MLKQVWNFELFAVEDSTVVEGKTVTTAYGVTVGKSIGMLVLFGLGYWASGYVSRKLIDLAARRLHLSPPLARVLRRWISSVLVLVVLELLWGRASLVVFAVFFNTGMPSTTGVILAVFNPENWEFLAVYLAVGGFFAGLVYATAVVSIPMILDRDTDAISAAITSLQVVFGNFAAMLLWGALITLLVVLALLPWGLGLLIIGPLLGHASWHAYRGSVRWLDIPKTAA